MFAPPVFIGVSMCMPMLALWPMHAPAEITTACGELVAAIETLRVVPLIPQEQQEQAASTIACCGETGQGNRVRLRSPEDLIRIDGIVRYARELNRCDSRPFSDSLFEHLSLSVELTVSTDLHSTTWFTHRCQGLSFTLHRRRISAVSISNAQYRVALCGVIVTGLSVYAPRMGLG